MTTTASLRGANVKPRRSREMLRKVTHPSRWSAGQQLGLKTLNVRSVERAQTFWDVLPVCLAHNLRRHNESHRHRYPPDPARTPLNSVLVGPSCPLEGAELAHARLHALGLKPQRRDQIAGIELVIQCPQGWDRAVYWDTVLGWIRARYAHVISAVVHRDQFRAHMHVIVLAIDGGRLAGAAMTSKRNRKQEQQRLFGVFMEQRLGIVERPQLRRQSRQRRRRTMADIFISRGKGARTVEAARRRDDALEALARRSRLGDRPAAPAAESASSSTSYCAEAPGVECVPARAREDALSSLVDPGLMPAPTWLRTSSTSPHPTKRPCPPLQGPAPPGRLPCPPLDLAALDAVSTPQPANRSPA